MATTSELPARRPNFKLWLIGLLVAFLAGLIPMAVIAYRNAADVQVARHELNHALLENRIAVAALFAKRGEYEQARQATSTFFGDLRTAAESSDSNLTPDQKTTFQTILNDRDQVITLLARSDAAGVDRLFDIWHAIHQALIPPKP